MVVPRKKATDIGRMTEQVPHSCGQLVQVLGPIISAQLFATEYLFHQKVICSLNRGSNKESGKSPAAEIGP